MSSQKSRKASVTPKSAKVYAFPKNFTWGVATAAPQIEGASGVNGKGPSVWDTFSRQPGAIADGSNLDEACDHYHLFDKDFKLMANLGIRNYRLSLAWPRIDPLGNSAWNSRGLDFYDRIFDSLDKHGITPWVTMFHWDLPQALEDRGGWRSRTTPEAYASYADTIVKRYGDRVRHWITLNEIQCFTSLAYGGGGKAPGTDEGAAVVNQTYHNALLAHGHGIRAVREYGRRGIKVGLTDNSQVMVPLTETPEDIEAARSEYIDENIRILDPIFRGHYSERYFKLHGKNAPKYSPSDFDLIAQPTDFLGQNIYTATFVRAGKKSAPERVPYPPHYPAATCTWLRIVPQSIYWGLRFASEIYGVKNLVITENGVGYEEFAKPGIEYPDLHRRNYVRSYLMEVHRAIEDGIPVSGYFLWSLLDNFEWQDGYKVRFGIVHTDYKTQRRTPKLSARWYAKVIKNNQLV